MPAGCDAARLVASIGGDADLAGGAPKLNSAGALEEGSEVPSACLVTPNPNPTGLPILPPTLPKVNPFPLGGEPPPNVPKALVGLSVDIGINELVDGVTEEPPNRLVVLPVLVSSFPVSLLAETLLNRSEDPGEKRGGLLESVVVPNNDVVVPNAEVGFEDESENADDASLDDAKKLGMAELEPKDVAESSLPLLVAGADGVEKENGVDFDELGSSDLVPNGNADFGVSEVSKVAAVMEGSSLSLAPVLEVGDGIVLDDDVENEKAL